MSLNVLNIIQKGRNCEARKGQGVVSGGRKFPKEGAHVDKANSSRSQNVSALLDELGRGKKSETGVTDQVYASSTTSMFVNMGFFLLEIRFWEIYPFRKYTPFGNEVE
ncbi:hypothetical protein JTB14_019615 [Gonioctena quinquepunctata]|nr:hypothetical protein JTB14_019615 [Gonioctena quinquepunctata]